MFTILMAGSRACVNEAHMQYDRNDQEGFSIK